MPRCQKCNRPATVHWTDLVKNGGTHLCATCAAGQEPVPGEATKLHAFLAELIQTAPAGARAADTDRVVCPNCGTTYREFRRVGRFGCADEYDAFGGRIEPLLEKVQGADQHVGKRPRSWLNSLTHSQLEQRLRAAVRQEDYEAAARLRDLIRDAKRN